MRTYWRSGRDGPSGSEVFIIGRREIALDSDPFRKPSVFKVGKAQAYCTACGGEEFVRSGRFRHEKADALACSRCGTEHPRSALMAQITKQVVERADLALKHAEELRTGRAAGQADAPGPDLERMLSDLREAAELLRFPAIEGHVGRASHLLMSIARGAPNVTLRHAAMAAMSLAGLSRLRAPSSEEAAELDRILLDMRRSLEASRRGGSGG